MSSSEQSQDKSKPQMNTKVKNSNRFHKGQSFNKSSTSFQSRSLIEHNLTFRTLPSRGSVNNYNLIFNKCNATDRPNAIETYNYHITKLFEDYLVHQFIPFHRYDSRLYCNIALH